MSYIQFQQQCGDCKQRWNAAFGIVGMTRIAECPTKCPHCGSKKISKIADGWATEPDKYEDLVDAVMYAFEAHWNSRAFKATDYPAKRAALAARLRDLIEG